MAKGWRSTTNIQFGKADGEVVVFGPGDLVEGLTAAQMAQLWEAGSLEETNVPDASAPESSTTTASPSTTEGAKSSGTASPDAPAQAQDTGGTSA